MDKAERIFDATVPNPVIAAAQLVISIHEETLEQIRNGHCYFDEGADVTELVRENALAGIDKATNLLHEVPPRLTVTEMQSLTNYTPAQDIAGLRTPHVRQPTRQEPH